MFRAIFCPSSGAWEWDFYSIWYPVVVVGREWVSGSVARCRSPTPCPPQQQVTICCKNLSLTLLMMGKRLPETCWADLIDQWIIVASSCFFCITLLAVDFCAYKIFAVNQYGRCGSSGALEPVCFGSAEQVPKNFKHKYSERKTVLVKSFVKLENTSA
jgi:hypothetical protein